MSTDVKDSAMLPVVRCLHGIDESKCIVCQDDKRAAELARQRADSEQQGSLASVPLLDSATGCAIVEAICAESDVSVAQLHQLVKVEQAQIGKLRKRGLWEAFDKILDGRTTFAHRDYLSINADDGGHERVLGNLVIRISKTRVVSERGYTVGLVDDAQNIDIASVIPQRSRQKARSMAWSLQTQILESWGIEGRRFSDQSTIAKRPAGDG